MPRTRTRALRTPATSQRVCPGGRPQCRRLPSLTDGGPRRIARGVPRSGRWMSISRRTPASSIRRDMERQTTDRATSGRMRCPEIVAIRESIRSRTVAGAAASAGSGAWTRPRHGPPRCCTLSASVALHARSLDPGRRMRMHLGRPMRSTTTPRRGAIAASAGRPRSRWGSAATCGLGLPGIRGTQRVAESRPEPTPGKARHGPRASTHRPSSLGARAGSRTDTSMSTEDAPSIAARAIRDAYRKGRSTWQCR